MTEEVKAERRFSVKSIRISRGYGDTGPFKAECCVTSSYKEEITVQLPDDRVLALIEQVDDLILQALTLQFQGMREDHLAGIEEQKQKLLESQTVEA